MQLIIEQLALYPPNPKRARELLEKMGMTQWVEDKVQAVGLVRSQPARNTATLAFNYQAAPRGALELEVLHYTEGDNWMKGNPPSASHLGMHCNEQELEEWRGFFAGENIPVVQEVKTLNHTNMDVSGKKYYEYVIFGTRPILGVDLKFIVRHMINA